MDRQTAQQIQTEARDAVRAVFEAHGLTMHKSSATFSDGIALRFEGIPEPVEGETFSRSTPEAKALVAAAPYIGFTFEHAELLLGATIVWGGKTYLLTGYSTRSPKWPLRAISMDPTLGAARTFKLPRAALYTLPSYDRSRDYDRIGTL